MPRITKRFEHRQIQLGNTDGLSQRQSEIAELMGIGLSGKEIAERLGISKATVDFHVDALKDRFYATNRLDLLSQMWMHGILEARGMVAALVVGLCVLSAFPMARPHRTPVRGSVRQEMRITKTARKELAAPLGEYA